MHYTHIFPRIGSLGMWMNPYFWIPQLIGLVTLIVVVVWIVRANRKRQPDMSESGREAIDLLKLKFVKGEIDEEAYLKKLTLLK